MINIEDFAKVDIMVGKIISAEKIPETDKLLKLSVDLGEAEPRQIVSGISLAFPDCTVLVGRKCIFVANLEPRMIRGVESKGMILTVSSQEGKLDLLFTDEGVSIGTRVK